MKYDHHQTFLYIREHFKFVGRLVFASLVSQMEQSFLNSVAPPCFVQNKLPIFDYLFQFPCFFLVICIPEGFGYTRILPKFSYLEFNYSVLGQINFNGHIYKKKNVKKCKILNGHTFCTALIYGRCNINVEKLF